jgi:pimeloyl-ACP methyl ester carboxylesterase
MADKRPKGILQIGWACLESTAQGRTEHRLTSADYPDTLVRRIRFHAGGGLGWRLSALTTPRAAPAPWKIVVITGAPSWAEYWAPAMAELAQDRQMLVVDRPGFAASEPAGCVPDLKLQAEALSPVLQTAPGQRLLLVGQSYGAAIAALLAMRRPKALGGLLLVSSYLGEPGPTARWLMGVGRTALGFAPRDLRNAVVEVGEARGQFELIRHAVNALSVPVTLAHGDADDFAPLDSVRRLAAEARPRRPLNLRELPGAGHFLNDGPVSTVLDLLEASLPPAEAAPAWRWPSLTSLAAPPAVQPA